MRTSRQLAVALALCSVLVSAQGCHRGMRQAPEAGPVALSIRNNAFFDVNVWALPTMGITPRVRLATVGGNSRVQLSVQPSSLRAGGVLVDGCGVRCRDRCGRRWRDRVRQLFRPSAEDGVQYRPRPAV